MLDQIMRWAEKTQSVRAVLLVGSLANGGKGDELSDYDLSIFGGNFDFIQKDEWLSGIASPLLCIHENFFWDDTRIPTRLTIFEDFIKADFAFHPSSLLKKMTDEKLLSPSYDAGYQVLLDKDELTNGLPKPTFRAYIKGKPTPQEFDTCVREFWFESYHVAKYLAREDLWVAQIRTHDMRKWLLAMLEWNAAASTGFDLRMKGNGKAMNEWVFPVHRLKLNECFAGWDQQAQQSSLSAMMRWFSTMAKETAQVLKYPYPETIDLEMTNFVSTLISQPHDSSKINAH